MELARLALPSLALTLLAGIAGCEPPAPQEGPVVVYVSLDEHYSKPILGVFEFGGHRVLARYDTEADKTTGLYLRLLQERNRPRADVFWNSEVLRTVSLAQQGILEPYTPPGADSIPKAYRDPQGRWTGFAARARVILYNKDLVPTGSAPRSIADLADPRFKDRSALALPLFGTSATHAGVLRAVLGKEAMEDLFRRFKANGIRAVNGNAVVRDLVASGAVAVGVTDSDDAHEAVRAGQPVAMVFPDQDLPFPGRTEPLGTLLIPNTVALVAGRPHPETARHLIDALLLPETEEMLARSGSAQIPLHPGLAPPPGLPLPPRLKVMEVDFTAAAKALEEAEPFLRDLFVR